MAARAAEPVARADFDTLMVPTYAPSDVVPVAGEGLCGDRGAARYRVIVSLQLTEEELAYNRRSRP